MCVESLNVAWARYWRFPAYFVARSPKRSHFGSAETDGGAEMREFETLELHTETLRELTPEELRGVAGGAATTTGGIGYATTFTSMTVPLVLAVATQVHDFVTDHAASRACG